MDIRTYLKDCFPDRAILQPNQAKDASENAIILQQLEGGKEAEIAKTKVRLVKDILEPTERDTLSISEIFPPRIKITKAGNKISKTYIPVADWNGKYLRIAIPENTINISVRNALFAGLSSLLRINDKETGVNALRQKMSLGLSKERKLLETNAEKNRKYAEKQMKEIRKFMESAVRQERIAAGLERLEEGQLNEFAKDQWEDLQQLIPGVLQEVYLKDDYLNAITNPIVVSGVFIGVCRIQIEISTAKIMVYAIENSTIRNGHCHPHVQNDGNPCWGNLEKSMTDMAAKRDYYGLINATLRLLHQYVHDDAYAKLHEWGRVAGKPEDGLNCQKYGPTHSYSQMRNCLQCEEICHISLTEKIEACKQMRVIEDCLSCNVGDQICDQFSSRFIHCFNNHCKTGIAYCLIKCDNEECNQLMSARHLCRKENLPKKEDCPAQHICRMPCKREEHE